MAALDCCHTLSAKLRQMLLLQDPTAAANDTNSFETAHRYSFFKIAIPKNREEVTQAYVPRPYEAMFSNRRWTDRTECAFLDYTRHRLAKASGPTLLTKNQHDASTR